MEQRNFYNEVNNLKKSVWSVNSVEELAPIRETFKTILNDAKGVLNENSYTTFRNNVVEQMKTLFEKKKDFLNKKKTFPTKQSFIFREEEGKAFIRLCDALCRKLNI